MLRKPGPENLGGQNPPYGDSDLPGNDSGAGNRPNRLCVLDALL
jgi:hypothetical protein